MTPRSAYTLLLLVITLAVPALAAADTPDEHPPPAHEAGEDPSFPPFLRFRKKELSMVRNVEGAGGGVRLPLAGPEPNARNLGASFAARQPFMLTREGARRTPPARSPLPNVLQRTTLCDAWTFDSIQSTNPSATFREAISRKACWDDGC